MVIDPNLVYTTKDASEILGIYTRKLTRLGKKYNVRKVDNTYVFDGDFLIKHLLQDNIKTDTESVLKVSEYKTTQLDLEIESLKAENEKLRDELKQAKEDVIDLEDNERIEIFTNDEYQILETRLLEWHEQQQKLQHQEHLFEVEKLSLKEMLEHYKNQFEYQKTQSEKILQMHQQLIDTIQKQNLNALQRNFIEAKSKGLDEK